MKILWELFKLYLLGCLLFVAWQVAPQLMDKRCASKWQASGMASHWEWGNGCMVEVDGRLLPEANVQISPKGR